MSNLKHVTDLEMGNYKHREKINAGTREKIGICRHCEEKRGHLKLVRLEPGADMAAKREIVPQWCGALQGSAAIATGLGLDGCS